ncbi:MAG TPA: sigma 54-interacting transcriptional regulator [Polyangiaceae bacterium]|nr:sigma 54-interacting transcriptional regulator [Polyangiaceae bacterium]
MTADRKHRSGLSSAVRLHFQTPSSLRDEIAGAPYLTLALGNSRQTYPLPWTGEVLIGRAENCHIVVSHKSVSRVNTRITTIRGEAAVTDLKSRNGTRVNGKVIDDTHALVSGDVVTVCDAELTFHEAGRSGDDRPILDFPRFKQRAEEELERLLLYQRPMAVLAAELATADVDRLLLARALGGLLRVIDLAASDGEGRVLILLTETDAERVPFALDRIQHALSAVAPVKRIGFATSPTDGFNFDALLARAMVERTTEKAPDSAPLEIGKQRIVAGDPTMLQIFALIERLARADLAVLITGETGTGKEVAAEALHEWSPRREKRFVTLNCAAFQENLLESELFGYERGAFSGAAAAKPGLLEVANGGTVLLDEIGELSATAQAKLLRVLETKRLTRLGGIQEREVDIRIVAATNRALLEEVKIGHFRQDLYFRLSAAIVEIPPLRERKKEIPLLAQLFLDRACDSGARTRMTLDPAALERLQESTWPGNVRQLRNTMEYVAATVPGDIVERGHLRSGAAEGFEERLYDDETTEYSTSQTNGARTMVERKVDLKQRFPVLQDEIAQLTARRIVQALDATGGNQTQAAKLIGMPLRTFISKLKELKPSTEGEGGESE